MAGHTLDGSNVCLVGIVSESKLVCLGLGSIVQMGSSAVGIDVEHIILAVSGLLEGKFHGLGLCGAVGTRCCGMIGIAGIAVTDNLRIDLCSTLLRMFESFQDQHCTTVAHDETTAVQVERKRCVLGIFRT